MAANFGRQFWPPILAANSGRQFWPPILAANSGRQFMAANPWGLWRDQHNIYTTAYDVWYFMSN